MILLQHCGVEFDQDSHRYFLKGKELKGITSTLIRRAFPSRYANVPDSVLKRAAERGKGVHSDIELLNTVYDGDIDNYPVKSAELEEYDIIVKTNHLRFIASEYLITDKVHYASAVDGVFTNEDGGVVLVDYKTTYQLYNESVQLQLSLYARFFELCNPGLKVAEIACMWLRPDEFRYAKYERISDDVLDALIEADIKDDNSYSYLPYTPDELYSLDEQYSSICKQIAFLQDAQNELRKKIITCMDNHHVSSCAMAGGTYSYTPAFKVNRFDVHAFKAAHPDTYKEFSHETETKPILRFRIKQNQKSK